MGIALSRRAQVQWPAGTEAGWRCEIAWQDGYRTSAFRAILREPGARRGRVVARSGAFKWLFKEPPDPRARDTRGAVRSLDAALVGAGWRRVAPGLHWYALRYVWPEPEAPPALHYTS